MTKRRNFGHLNNGLAAALEVVGEWWTPLIVWSVLHGHVRFEPVQSELLIARNILTDRLKSLVNYGVLERKAYSDRPERFEYLPTERAYELYPILALMKQWGEKWMLDGVPSPRVVHTPCSSTMQLSFICLDCGEVVKFEDTHIPGDEV